MTWRLVAWLGLVSFACGCNLSDGQPSMCLPKYPVAPGDHGFWYEAKGEMRVVSSMDVEVIDSTFLLTADVRTLDEESNLRAYGVEEPRLYLSLSLYQPANLTGCARFVSDPPEIIELSLDGSINRFRCFGDPDSDAQLVVRNVGQNAIVDPYPHMLESELMGTYTQDGGAEVYEVRLQPFWKELKGLPCSDPMAKR